MECSLFEELENNGTYEGYDTPKQTTVEEVRM